MFGRWSDPIKGSDHLKSKSTGHSGRSKVSCLFRSHCSCRTIGLLLLIAITCFANARAQEQKVEPKTDVQSQTDESSEQVSSEEEEKERVAADRFLEVLIKRPTTGTALDKVFGYHVAKGDLGEVVQRLSDKAAASQDIDEAGRLWMLVGLLQLQRGEDAAAVKALAKAQSQLATNSLAAYQHGQALLLIGDTEAAAAALQVAIDRKPPKAEYLAIGAQLGRLYQRAGKVAESIKVWNELERTFPNDDGVRHRIAATLAEEGDLQGALARYESLAKTARVQNDQMVFAINAADLRIQLGQREHATRDLEALLTKLRPNSYLYDDARRRIETAFLSSGDYAGLAEYYEHWVQDHKDDIDAVLRLARILSIQGRNEESLKWFGNAIERAPTDVAPRLAIIDAYLADSRFADAAKQFEQLVATEGSNPDYLVRWGQVLMSDTTKTEAERQQAATAVWKRLAAARPKDAAIQSQVADLMRGAKLIDEALAGYRTAASLAPDEPQHKEYLGEYLHQLGRKDEALDVWRSIAAGEQRTRENLIRLSEVLHQFDQRDEALLTLVEACTMRPKVHERLRLAEWYRDGQQFEKALEQIELARNESETVDERDRVFASAVQTYQVAGQLQQRIEAARTAAQTLQTDTPKSPEASELWRQLAVLLEANRQTQESLDAIDKAVEAAPTNIETLDIAARMFEDAGRLPLAIEKRRLLADSDRRFRNGHLQRLASLYIQSGNTDAAITAGREMLSGAGGSVDAFKFYADLCGQAGRGDERIDTLRRCLRLNPRSEDAQQLLATQLAEDFKTEQAIELYWKMLDGSGEIEKRRELVKKLADLYLRTNRLDQLISRIELRGRESGDRRTSIDLVATAYQQAGDLGLAREALEGLLRESGRDTLLLERLVGLAEQSGEIEKAIELQRQVLRLAPGRTAESRLASLLTDIGSTEEAQAMWLSMLEKSSDEQQIASSIDRLFAAGESKVAIEVCRKAIESRPEDWETRLKLAVLLAESGDWENAAKTAAEIRAMTLDETTLPAGAKAKPPIVGSSGMAYQPPPVRISRVENIYPLLQILDERYGYQSRTVLPKPIDFGHAKLMAMYIEFKNEANAGGDLTSKVSELEKLATEKEATPKALWNWYETQAMAASAQQTPSVNFQSPKSWELLWRLADIDSDGELILIQLLSNRQSYAGRPEYQIKLEPLSDERLAWLKALAAKPRTRSPSNAYLGRFDWATAYATELKIAGKSEDAEAYLQEQVARVLGEGDAFQLFSKLQYLTTFGTDEQLWPVIQRLLDTDSQQFVQQYGRRPDASLFAMFASETRIDEKLSKGAVDPEYRQRLIKLFDALMNSEAEATAKRKSLRLTGVGGPRSTYKIVKGSYSQIEVAFPPKGLGPDDDFVQAFYGAWGLLKDHSAEWLEHLGQSQAGTSDRQQVMIKLSRATLMQWNDRPAEATAELQGAIEFATEKVPTLESDLRLMQADLLLRQNRKSEALTAIEMLSVYDQNTMAIREFSAAKLAAALGDKQRAQAAAKRLFGVRLDTESQVELAKLMRSLDMHELASDLVRRLRSRGGSSTEQLRALLTYFQTQEDKDQTAQVAMEVLQRTSPARAASGNRSRTITTAESQLRNTAIQALATSGKLTGLIEATEKRLEQSPKSQRLRAELSELYVGIGKADKAAALFADSTTTDIHSTVALEAAAKQLVLVGKFDEACEAYLKILRRKPQLFQNDFYEIKQPFDRTKRVGELVDLVLEVGLQKFEAYRVAELCGYLLRESEDIARARKLYLAILDMPPSANNAIYSLNSVMSNGRELLKDKGTLEKTVQYLIKGGKNSVGDWNTLFRSYSTDGDGRHNNATTTLTRAIANDEESCAFVENAIREVLKEKADWHEGKAWLAMLLTVRKQYAEAKSLLEPLLSKEMRPQPTYYALWLIGSLIDEHKPMQELAAKMYDFAILNTANQHRANNFQYSLENRACKLMATIGHKERARELVLQAIDNAKKQPKQNYGNEEYEAYDQIRTAMSMMDMLASVDYPAEALRIARELDRALFTKAGQYQQNVAGEFKKREEDLLEAVRKLGGLQTAETMVEYDPKGASAIDLGITFGERPFSDRGIQSLWIDLVEEAQGKPDQAESLAMFTAKLRELSETRSQDDSAVVAWAITADVANDRAPLRNLIARWLDDTSKNIDLKLRQRCITLAALRLDRSPGNSEEDRRLIESVIASASDWEADNQLFFLAELGRQAHSRSDSARVQEVWSKAGKLVNASQMQLLDLSVAAANADLSALSLEVAFASTKSPKHAANASNALGTAGNLGELLGRSRTSSSGMGQTRDEPNSAESQLAKRVIELDRLWSDKKVAAAKVIEPLLALTQTETGNLRLLASTLTAQNNNLAIDSVYDRLAKHAHEAKQTDMLLTRLMGNDLASHLFAVMALLRGDRAEEAKARLEAIELESLPSVPKEVILQSLAIALEQNSTRQRAVEIGLSLLEINKPSERYEEVQPFDTFAIMLVKRIVDHNLPREMLQSAANHYLTLTQHDNDRYNGSYGLQRRASQLDDLAKMFLEKGINDEALKYLGMRQSVFNLGNDQNLDWVGNWALENLQSQKDRKSVYKVIADWTFAGDGSLNSIKTFSRRQRLPNWIPEAISGGAPTFPPVVDPELPIATNYFFLAKLAQETNQVDDLKQRYTMALAQDRVGAAEGLAIALAVLEQPIAPEVFAIIDKRLDSIAPGEEQTAKGSMPLAEVQLAALLGNNAEHAPWAKATFEKAVEHGHPLNRGYVHPWLSRFQYRRGWTESAKLQPADQLAHWLSSTSASAHDYYEGDPAAIWVTDGDNRLDHVCGFATNFMWFRYPLEGNFEFEAELPSGGWRGSELWARGVRFGSPAATAVDIQGDEGRSWVRFPTQAIKDNEWNKHAIKVEDGQLSYSINGILIYQEKQASVTPWMALRSQGTRSTYARNIKITGKPTIPRTVDMIQNGHLRGWTGVYYGQPLPSSLLDTTQREDLSKEATMVRAGAKLDNAKELAWTVRDGELINGGNGTTGPGDQSLIQYQRPLADGEKLSYEFYYEAGKTEVHPAIGRTAFILRPEGVKFHWMTEPNSSWSTPADNEFPVPGAEAKPLPLQANQWNQLAMARSGQTLTISLNDEQILQQPCDLFQGDLFGLFHYRNKSSVRVRSAQLRGEWPEDRPEKLFEKQSPIESQQSIR